MAIIEEFPDDDGLWMVKHTDRISQPRKPPHTNSRATSISVLLQKLPITKLSELHALSRKAIQAILGGPRTGEPNKEFLRPSVLSGTFPFLYPGAVFQRREWVGHLPMDDAEIELTRGEDSCQSVTIDATFSKGVADVSLNPQDPLSYGEYYGVKPWFPKSQVLVVSDATTDYIIPRSEIFRKFYALNSHLARAFTNGPWQMTAAEVIYLGSEMESGLQTKIASAPGMPTEWHIILQTRIVDSLHKILALLYFDEYGRKCANAIYTDAHSERKASGGTTWHITAKIPIRSHDRPLRLNVRGWELARRALGADGQPARRRFYVASITAYSYPTYLPTIRFERFNSGKSGDEKTENQSPAPYGANREAQPAAAQTGIDDTVDPNVAKELVHFDADDVAWIGAPEDIKLTKFRSKAYAPHPRSPKENAPPESVSTGEDSYQQSSPAEGNVDVPVRPLVDRFVDLEKAFAALFDSKAITGYRVFVPAPSYAPILNCSGFLCWNMLDPDARRGVRRIRGNRWRYLETGDLRVNERTPRAALVMQIDTNRGTGYWIEVETRPGEGLLSIFVNQVEQDSQALIDEVLEALVGCYGVSPAAALRPNFDAKARCRTFYYRHAKAGSQEGPFNSKRMERLIQKAWSNERHAG